jgi:sortase A
MTHTPNTNGTDDKLDANPPASRATSHTRLRTLIAAGAVLTAAAVTATLVISGEAATNTAGPAATPASTTEAPANRAQPDPLTSTAPAGDTWAPDETGTAATTADRTLSTWSSTNPASSGARAVGGEAATGPGGAVHEVLRIPALGKDWAQPVYDGVTNKQLRAGVGHFSDTEQPGDIGNYALAGHRSGVADPAFRYIDHIRTGSVISVTTAHRITYTYTVIRVHTVAPADVTVIAQVPGKPNAVPTKAKLTLVTCWPANGHSKRVIVEADLTSSKGGA